MIPHVGSQLWADVRWRHGWRVQSHVALPVSRLLDPVDEAHKHGSLEACERALDQMAPRKVSQRHLVVLIHGLGRTRYSMRRLDRAITAAGMTAARLDYPSMRRTIQEHASQVAEVLDHLERPKKLSFVTHSLGGLIVRELFAKDAPWQSVVNRVVMLAPPNQGAASARSLDTSPLRTVMGPSFRQIAEGAARGLPVPRAPVAIVAAEIAHTGTDGLVTVEETKLDGMAAHWVVPSVHTFVMNHPTAIRRTLEFLS
ncbi:MAG: alpha/beta fold hydrolase [Myxococcota bacterium]